ncbi:response regulator [Frateuria sp. YIM B11624]|uniref:response regulator n=1 Tax=Frateuria sp. YIM B11624 TaxID=3143185 RepID=UPI003C778EC1
MTNTDTRRILVVEDDESVRDAIVGYLDRHGFSVRGADGGVAMDRLLAAQPADLVVLDLMMPGEDGLSICRRLHERSVPVLVLSALGETSDRIVGLELGASDYLAKPFDPRELVARIRAVLRRQQTADVATTTAYHFDGFRYDPSAAVLLDPRGQTVPLTAGELRLLAAFVKRPAQLLSRDQLLDLTQHDPAEHFDRAIDLSVSRLRRKLGAAGAGESIETVRGLGYRFRATVTRQ